jgi:hypothetical protein
MSRSGGTLASMVSRNRAHGQQGLGAIEGLHLAFLVTHNTNARCGGLRYRPTMSRSLDSGTQSTVTAPLTTVDSGSFPSLSLTCWFSPTSPNVPLGAVGEMVNVQEYNS